VVRRQQEFGYTDEELRILLAPMAMAGAEPIGSMGTDSPIAVLSQRPRLLFDYFSQLFAQVTNPPLDAIREELVTSLAATIGPERNLLEPTAASCRQLVLPFPVIDNTELAKIIDINADGDLPGFASVTIAGLYEVDGGGSALRAALDRVRREVSAAIAGGARIVVLSDRGGDPSHAPIPSLLLTAAVHHHLVRERTRTQVGLIVEAGDCREVHHLALLLGYGAAAVNPYLAFETVEDLVRDGLVSGVDAHKAVRNYLKALGKGVLKVMSKMGISTVASYAGAQVFEALGLSQEIIDDYFTGTSSKLGGSAWMSSPRRSGRGIGGIPGESQRVRAPTAARRRRISVAARGTHSPVQPRDRVPAAARHPQPQVEVFRRYTSTVDDLSRQARRCAGSSPSVRAFASRCRWRRSSRSARSSSDSLPARCPTARFPGKRTRRSLLR